MNICTDLNDTVPLDSLLRHVIPTVNNLPYDLGVDLLRQAFTEFARRSEMLAANQEIFPQKDVEDYELIPPEGYEIYKIRSVGRGSSQPITQPNAHYWNTHWGIKFEVVSNKYVLMTESPNSDSDPAFYIVSTVIPNECMMRIPREVAVPFGARIAKGALAEALLYKNKPWYDPNLAVKMQREFDRGVASGGILNTMNRGGASMKARTRRWL